MDDRRRWLQTAAPVVLNHIENGLSFRQRLTDISSKLQDEEQEVDMERINKKIETALKSSHAATPGEDEKKWEEEENREELPDDLVRQYRGYAARLNNLAADRPDISYAVKEVCRGMAKPTRGHCKTLKRIGRYLIDAGRMVTKYRWQE